GEHAAASTGYHLLNLRRADYRRVDMSAHQRRDSSGRIAGLQYPHVFVRIEFPIAHYDASDNIRARSITAACDCLTFAVGWAVDTFAYDKIGPQTVEHDRYDLDLTPAGNH